MSEEEEELYCRLCAEPTPKTGLITSEDDVAISSKVITKMRWLNIDVSETNVLPKTICFSCFDLLERTWYFLHNVRLAQQKLNQVFLKKSDSAQTDQKSQENDLESQDNVGKPVDKDWEEFETKEEVKIEATTELEDMITTVDPTTLLDLTIPAVKAEQTSEEETKHHFEGYNSTDSDMPLLLAVKKKSVKKKKKSKLKQSILETKLSDSDINQIQISDIKTEADIIDLSTIFLTWDDYMCRCGICDALCKNIASLRLHSLQIHNSCCIFKCSDCGKVLTSNRSFISHVRLHKTMLRYSCEFCNKQFTLPSFTKKHRSMEHKDIYLTMCQTCGSNFDTQEFLDDHIAMYTKSYKKPRRRDSLEKDLKCNECSKEFKSQSNLQQHKLVHTKRSRDFSCHVCGKMFFTKGTLSTHMATHEDTKPFKCEFCPMSFRARGNLQSHSSLHSGVKPFVCEQCGKSFRVKRHLKSHSIVHTDLMPYICEYCNKPFRFKTRLNLHLRQHTGAKPYTCVFCQRDFTNGSNYKKHMKRRHNIDTSRKKYNNIVNDQGINVTDTNGTQS